VRWDPGSAEHLADPYAVFAAARRDEPVFFSSALDAWVVSRYADVEAIVTDHERFSNAAAIVAPPGLDPAAASLLGGFGWRPNFDTDPPDHTRIRHAVSQAFTARRIAALAPDVRALAHSLIDDLVARRQTERGDAGADIVAGFCLPLPARVIFRMLGVPDDDVDRVHLWTRRFIELYVAQIVDGDDAARARDCVEYWDWCLDLIARRAAEPGDDLISGLVTGATEAGAAPVEPPLDHAEIASICMLLVVAGHETTTNMLGSLLLHLLSDRRRYEAVRADPSRVPAAVEEALRVDAPVQVLHRVTTVPVTIGGVVLPAGAKVMVPFGAANHDDAVFADPDAFDLTRDRAARHLAFSKGVHYCLGAPLARLEGRVALEVLVERLPDLRLAGDEVRYHPVFSIRSLQSLAVTWRSEA
jgi:cytochrome P450